MDASARRTLISSATSAGSDARLWVLGEWKEYAGRTRTGFSLSTQHR